MPAAILKPNKKRKQAPSDEPAAELLPEGGLEMLSEDEGEGEMAGEDEDEDGVDAFPELDAASDSEGDEESDEEDEPDVSDEGESSDTGSDDSLHIFPKAKTIISDITGEPKKVYPEIEPDYDSDSSTEDAPNRVGNIPMHWYDDLPHVGYDINGKKVLKPARGDELDRFLQTVDDPTAWTSAFDKNMQMDKPLTSEELDIIRRLERHENPDADYNPYEPTIEWFTGKGKEEIMPLSAAPEPKRRWIPSKWEKQKVMKIVRAIRQGRIVPNKPKSTEPSFYSIWNDEASNAVPPMPAPKPRLPTHAESYNPPPEYLPTDQERKEWEETEPEDRDRNFLPQKYSALRLVPAYDRFIQERFGRQLDLYLAPRIQRTKLTTDPSSLVPKLPSPASLRPFPTHRALRVLHTSANARVRCVSVSPDGAWVASADESGVISLWETIVGREVKRWTMKEKVGALDWSPRSDVTFLVAATEEKLHFLMPPNLPASVRATTLDVLAPATLPPPPAVASPVKWTNPSDATDTDNAVLTVLLPAGTGTPKNLSWHRKGDYLATVSASGEGQGGVWIHQLSRRHSQAPFRKIKGSVQAVAFHPSKPHFFVATQRYVRVYNLAEQTLLKTLLPGIRWISSLDVHPTGDHLIVGGYDRKLCWFDLALSDKPYKIMRYHSRAIRSLAFHPTYPLFASASDDGSVQVFHARIYGDLMADPLIVPLKILRGHEMREGLGVLALRWVPRQPWLVSAGADGSVAVWAH
ncbi:BOP1NT-domain-containing protein [Peniophora sp. CONT]|nr:BOP1NT-domain-containing protein [Peniophora sp. CONT]